MLIIIISRSGSKLGHVGSKTRSLGQILEKPFVHAKVYSLVLNVMKLCQNVNHRLKLGHVGSKTRSLVNRLLR